MLKSVLFMSRYQFERRGVAETDIAISIGDPDQATPAVAGCYLRSLRVQFLDLEPEVCQKHGMDQGLCMSTGQARAIAGFISEACLGGGELTLIIHCEAGASRSAAVALAAAAFAGLPAPEKASGANLHVLNLLQGELYLPPISVPPDFEEVGETGVDRWF